MIIRNSNLRRFLADNKYTLLGIIIAVILFLCVIQLLDTLAENELNNRAKENINNVSNTTSTQYRPQETVIYGQNVSDKEQQTNEEVIEKFISYCNNKNIQQAYNMITDECKEEVFFNNITNFQENYVNKIFDSKKIYSMQSWVSTYANTYRMLFSEDALATGQVTQNKIEDYYTIVDANGESKLNISGYIGRQEINAVGQADNITIQVLTKDIYKDYEIYNIKVENNTGETIILDGKQNTESVYLLSSNEQKFTAYMYELDDTRLIVDSGFAKTMSIRFNKIYSNRTQMTKMVFEDIIKDYDTYKTVQNKKEYSNKTRISIELD